MSINLFHYSHPPVFQNLKTPDKVKRLILAVLLLLFFLPPTLRADASKQHKETSELRIEKLTAFTRMYGYVRFFHPSDQASLLDWNKMALYGANEALNSNNDENTQEFLQRVFGPIVVDLEFYSGEEKPHSETTEVNSADIIAWQHIGVGLGNKGIYNSKRTNRDPVPYTNISPRPFGYISQNIDETTLRGKEARFRFNAIVDQPDGSLHGWWKVVLESKKIGLFDNMTDRPITAPEWSEYELKGIIDDDADSLTVGFMKIGTGSGLVDDITLEVKDEEDTWTNVDIENSSFELGDKIPDNWETNTYRGQFQFVLDRSNKTHGEQSLRIRARSNEAAIGANETLFPKLPKLGEVIDSQICEDLRLRIPLTLPISHQYSNGDNPDIDEHIEKVNNFTTEEHAATALANVAIIWNIMQHFYPYFDQIETDWNEVLLESIDHAKKVRTREDVTHTLQWLVAQLQDGHGNVRDLELKAKKLYLPLSFGWIDNALVVIASREPSIRPGDVITKFNGQEPLDRLIQDEQYLSGSPQWKRFISADKLSTIKGKNASISLEIERGNQAWATTLLATKERNPAPYQRPQIDIIEQGEDDGTGVVYYVDLGRVEAADVDPMIEKFANAKGIIFDLRGYPIGTHYLYQHFTDKHLQSAQFSVAKQIQPNRIGMGDDEESSRWELPPLEPRFKGKKVFITNGSAISYAESCMAIIANHHLAPIVGTPTAGANGNINPFYLPGKYRVVYTGMRVINHDGSQHHVVGVQPTIQMKPTIEGVRQGRDELLEKAIEVINE